MLKKVKRKVKKNLQSINNGAHEVCQLFRDIAFTANRYILHGVNGKSSFYLPYFRSDYIQQTIFKTVNYFEKDNLDFVCKEWNNGIISERIKSTCTLDIGCNIGNHTLYYLNECNAQFVHCFEPIADTHRILCKNIRLNKLENKTKNYNVGVGTSSSMACISHYDKKNIGGTSIKIAEDGNIPVVSIDDLKITNVGLIKIDVEGFELNVLKGMVQTLKRDLPYITIEIRDSNFSEVLSLLESIGYQYVEIEEHRDYRDYNDYLFYVGK